MIDEKIKLEEYFKDEINRVSNIEIQQIDEEIAKIKEQSIDLMDAEAKREAEVLRESEFKELTKEHAIAISKVHEETNRKLMAKRKEYNEAIFQEVRDRLQQFAKSDQYEAYLLDRVKKLSSLSFPHIVFYVAQQDEAHVSAIKKAYGKDCEGCIDASIQLGGFRMECEAMGVDMDETFDTALEEQKEWFYTNSGLFIK